MLKTDLPPDSSWKWEVKIYEDPLPTGRYVLADDYKKLETVVNQLKMDEAAAMALCMNHEGHIEKITKERDQAVEYLSMRMEDLNKEGKTILDFQAVWIRQARSTNERLLEKVATLETKLSECETLKRGYYDEAAKGWEKFRELERKINEKEIREEKLVKEAYRQKEK